MRSTFLERKGKIWQVAGSSYVVNLRGPMLLKCFHIISGKLLRSIGFLGFQLPFKIFNFHFFFPFLFHILSFFYIFSFLFPEKEKLKIKRKEVFVASFLFILFFYLLSIFFYILFCNFFNYFFNFGESR